MKQLPRRRSVQLLHPEWHDMSDLQVPAPSIGADELIATYLTLDKPQSFFLSAGAGSGKTWSLVAALNTVRRTRGKRLLENGQRVAVITYTKAASEEIRGRLGNASIADVSTLHSFAWSLLSGFDEDIRLWLRDHLEVKLRELVLKESMGKATSKASIERRLKIKRYSRQIELLPSVHQFTYSPDQIVPSRGALTHAQVIQATADFIRTKHVFREIAVGRYPIIFVDEAQDTQKVLMDALLSLADEYKGKFVLGLFGDMMQRIYFDGKPDLQSAVESWEQPRKTINRRSSRRVVALANQLRKSVDGLNQQALEGAAGGTAHLFVSNASSADRVATENEVAKRMAGLTGDQAWRSLDAGPKVLILEHSMAASRLGFTDFFASFDVDASIRSAITSRESLDSGPVGFLAKQVLPLWRAVALDDSFAVDELIRKYSPLYNAGHSLDAPVSDQFRVPMIRNAIRQLRTLLRGSDPAMGPVLRVIHESQVFELPDQLADALFVSQEVEAIGSEGQVADDRDAFVDAWAAALHTGLGTFERYYSYATGASVVDTQQGVKGLEFDHVMVVLDDQNSRGRGFSYEKLLDVKAMSETDREHLENGEETTIDRTRRLFYVACSRARSSLAVVAYTANPQAAVDAALEAGLFAADEFTIIPS